MEYSVKCGLTNLPIYHTQECAILPIQSSIMQKTYYPTMLPIFGIYNGYSDFESIYKDKNTELIENFFQVPIEEFVSTLIKLHMHNGKLEKNNYTNYELIDNGKIEFIRNWRVMYIHKKGYDLFTKTYLKSESNYMKVEQDVNQTITEWEQLSLNKLILKSPFYGMSVNSIHLGKVGQENEVDELYLRYMRNLDTFGVQLHELNFIKQNLYFMSTDWTPHNNFVVRPEFEERINHNILLNKIMDLNKEFIIEDLKNTIDNYIYQFVEEDEVAEELTDMVKRDLTNLKKIL